MPKKLKDFVKALVMMVWLGRMPKRLKILTLKLIGTVVAIYLRFS